VLEYKIIGIYAYDLAWWSRWKLKTGPQSIPLTIVSWGDIYLEGQKLCPISLFYPNFFKRGTESVKASVERHLSKLKAITVRYLTHVYLQKVQIRKIVEQFKKCNTLAQITGFFWKKNFLRLSFWSVASHNYASKPCK